MRQQGDTPFSHTPGTNTMMAAPVRVSLDWLRRQKSVPVCGGRRRDEFSAGHSLTVSRTERVLLPDGTVRIQVPAGRWLVQFIAVVSAGIGLVAAVFVPIGMMRQSMAGIWPTLLAGSVAGAIASRWLIRRHPAVLLDWHPSEGFVVADRGSLRIPRADIERLILVTGTGFTTLPSHPGSVCDDRAATCTVLLVKLKSESPDEAGMIFRYALPATALRKAAGLASATLGVPLEEWDLDLGFATEFDSQRRLTPSPSTAGREPHRGWSRSR